MWLNKLILILKDRQLRNKILFILLIFAIFRLVANIPVSGIDIENLKKFFTENQFLGLLNVFVGGALSNFSIVMLGLGPYITAIIIMQLLTMIFPQLEKLYKEEGDAGRRKFNQYGRILTIPLAVLQSYGMLVLFQKQNIITTLNPFQLITVVITVTAGSLFLMWLGELISEKGIGNGVSLLIFAGIVAQTPMEIRQLVLNWDISRLPFYLLFFVMTILIIFGIVYITEARRNIPVSYTKRVRGHRMYGGISTHLPININPAGVIPIIFAIAILLFPTIIANFLGATKNPFLKDLAQGLSNFFQNVWVYGILLFILVFLFTFFYTAITFDPKNVAKNLQKMGGFIPGVRPGSSTAEFFHKILYRVLFIGAFFLGIVAIMPSIIQGITGIQAFNFLIGGTALLIVVSVGLDTWRQIKAQMKMREYERI